MAEFNPSSTGTKGIEWFPTTEQVVTLDSLIKCAAVSVVNTTSQGTNNVKVPVTTIPVRGGLYAVEVYDNETGVAANVTTLTAQPNEDVAVAAWTEESGTTTTIYTQIDEVGAPVTTDYIKLPTPTTPTAIYTGRFNTGGLSLTSKRILAVRLNINCLLSGNASLQAGLNISGVDYVPINVSNLNGTTSYTWLYNPNTNLPWRIADVQALDTTDEFILAGYAGNPDGVVRVYQVSLDVVICDENRLAFGALNDLSSALTANAWNTVAVLTPTSGAWTKDGAGYHFYTVRRMNSVGSLNVPYLYSPGGAPPPARAHAATLDSTYGYITANSAVTGYVHPWITQTASVDSVDGMPYFDLIEATVYTGASRPAQAEFSNAAAAAYGIIRTYVKPNGATQSLTIQIWNRTGPAQVGGTLTLTKAQVDALPDAGGGWKAIVGQLSSNATLAAATQYYILYQSTATGVGTDYWSVMALDTLNSGNTASFGSTTDRGTFNAIAEADRYDVTGTVSTVPTVPANFTATLTTQNVTDSACSVLTLQRASLAWTATALGGTFTRYEIERTEDGGTTWVRLADVTVESVAAWIDYEGLVGTACGYRIRVVRSDGAVSSWSSTVTVTKTAAAQTCVLAFVSNYSPNYNLIYDYHPEVDYDFLEDEERVVLPIYGVDKSLGFQPIENRGTRGNWRLWVGWNGRGTAVNGKQVFDPLRTTARAQLPYVCVLDHFGNRMYAQLSVGQGRQVMPQQEYTADVAATEVVNEFVPTVTA